jgi:hypothetical protein
VAHQKEHHRDDSLIPDWEATSADVVEPAMV